MLEGKNVNLKVVEKEDLPQMVDWFNNSEFWGQYDMLLQMSKAEAEKSYESPNKPKDYFIQKKDGTKVGFVRSWEIIPTHPDWMGLEFGYAVLPSERRKGYCSEAVNLLLDFAFLSSTVFRIQARTDVRNVGSQRVLEKTGFKKEGTIRKGYFSRGELRDSFLYSILRDEWKEPTLLSKLA